MDYPKNEQNPPPYSPGYYPQNPAPPPGFHVGQGNIAVVSPAADYNSMGDPENGHSCAPPEYSQGFEDQETYLFSDATIRRGFVRKVYLTLMVQLLITVGLICVFLFCYDLKEWVQHNSWFTFTMMGLVFGLIIVLACCDSVRRKVPLNFIFLGLFTIVEGFMLGSVTVFYEADAVLWAVGATALVSLAMSVFAMQTKWDFTAASGTMWAIGWTLISFGLLCAILRTQYLYIVYASLGTLVFSIYLVMDTQLMLGGKHKYSISPEEYIFAALNLYLDIVTLFLFLLQLIGLCR
ncbi:protein lifeguard 1 [Conger conger]|uniref:protein lifeguard 1 n=1 Tax=Conger conger TaxID=82655 RepID=UPI002A5A439F|nr:protein lifeguard 1 [Conger conger]